MPAPWNDDPLPEHLLQQNLHDTDSLEVAYTHYGLSGTGYTSSFSQKVGSVVAAASRPHPLSHPTVDAPICPECLALENTFFDPACKACRRKLQSGDADIAHVFAVLRQWVPQVMGTEGELNRQF